MYLFPSKSILSRQRINILGCLLCMVILASSETSAQTGEPTETIETTETLVTISTRQAQSSEAIAQSISQIDNTDLNILQTTHIQEALLRVPGANLQRGNGQEYLPSIRSPVLTGAGACGSVLMMEDGIPLRPTGFCNINELFEAHTELADSIEVQRGPGTVFYGSNAQHGLVNIRSVGVADDLSSLSVELGPHSFVRTKLVASGDDSGIKVSLAEDGGYRDDSGYGQQKVTAWKNLYTPDFDLDIGLTLVNLNQETAGYITGEDAYQDSDLAKSNSNPEAFRDAFAARIWSRFNFDLDGGSSLVVTPYARYSKMDFLQHFLPGDPLEENGQTSVGVQTAYHSAAFADQSIQIASGIDLEATQAFLKQGQDAATQGSAFLQETVPEGAHYDYQVDALMLAGFVQADWQSTDRLALVAGLRLEYLEYQYDNQMLSGRTRADGSPCGFGGCRYSRPEDRQDSFTNLSPKLGLIYQLAASHQLSLSLAQGYRAPQATELYRLQRAQTTASLETEKLNSIDLGMRGDFSALSYGLSFYLMEKENFIFRDSDFFNISDGETQHRGVELEFDYALNEDFDLGINASFARHRYTYQDVLNGVDIFENDIDSAPRQFGSAQIGWRYSEKGRAELEWVHMGEYFLDPENLHSYAGHNLMNLRFNHQLNSNWNISARLLNLTNQKYAERADYTSFTDERYFPGEPRSLFVSVGLSW